MGINRYHLYYWLFHYLLILTLDIIYYKERFNIATELLMVFTQLSVFYSLLLVLLHFKKNNIRSILRSIFFFLLSFAFCFFLVLLRDRLYKLYGFTVYESVRDIFFDTMFRYFAFGLYAVGCYFIMRYGTKQKELRELAEAKAAQDVAAAQLAAQNAQMKQDILELENNFLRAQINPHFLYNTLNTFYAKAFPFNEELAYGIVTLSNIMRYALESTEHGQLSPLQMEVAQLERVIKMHRYRFGNQLSIDFITEGDMGELKVAPLVFVTLLENALKHGEAGDADNPISLWLSVDAKHIYFTIRNKKGQERSGGSSGIGLLNITKRLTSVYGNHYKLDIEETGSDYHVALVIEHGAGIDIFDASPATENEIKY